MLTKKELKDNAVIENDTIVFALPVAFSEFVHNCSGIEMLNDMVGEFVENGYMLEGMSYTPIAIADDNRIIIQVTANCVDWDAYEE